MTEKRSLKWKNNNNTVSLILGLEKMAEMADYLNENFAAEKMPRASPTILDKRLISFYGMLLVAITTRSLGTSSFDTMDIAQVLLAEIGSSSAPPKEFLGNLNDLKLPAGYSNGTAFCGHTSCCQSLLYELSLGGLSGNG